MNLRRQAKAAALSAVRKIPETFCLSFNHAEVAFGPVVVERDAEIVVKGEGEGFMDDRSIKQVLGFGLLGATARAGDEGRG